MVAIPIGYDQPGVAARIAHHGVGEFLEIEDLAVERLRHLIEGVLDNPRYRDKAGWFQKVITQTRGLDVAAEVIERAFNRNHKVGVNSSLRFAGRRQNIAAQTD
jgi:UDP:flavonoid glycosyltransferase YjiC (YdhE family)